MASAKKCDVCGKLYEYPICNDIVRIHLDFGYAGDRYVDLCEDCYDKLCNFIRPTLPKDGSVERQKVRKNENNQVGRNPEPNKAIYL